MVFVHGYRSVTSKHPDMGGYVKTDNLLLYLQHFVILPNIYFRGPVVLGIIDACMIMVRSDAFPCIVTYSCVPLCK